MKKLLCLLLCGILLVSGTALAVDGDIDYPHFMYSMETVDFGEEFKTLGRYYESLPIIVPFYISSSDRKSVV